MFLVREVSRKATFLSVHISDIFSAAFLFHCLALTVQKETNIVLTKSLWEHPTTVSCKKSVRRSKY